MKRKLLIIVLCLTTVAAFSQSKSKKKAVTRRRTTTANRKPVAAPPAASQQVADQAMTDTTRKIVSGPAKPFERPLDGYYKKTNILSAKVTPYPNLREADAAYVKRIWREIDIREKLNSYLNSPKQRLIDVLMTAINNGELTAYDANATKDNPGGDGFTRPLTPAEANGFMSGNRTDSIATVDKKTGEASKITTRSHVFNSEVDTIFKFRIKEDWIFDKQRSIFEPRIVGIAPMIKPKADLDFQPAFWIYFTDARPILATKEAVSANNDATGLSFDDVFMKRIFTAYIVKQSNPKDERIKDYAQGIDRLYESEKIKKSLMDWELNLWQY